jgi:hypothetical protein
MLNQDIARRVAAPSGRWARHGGRRDNVIPELLKITLPHVGFGMRGETGGQGAGEIVGPDRVQFVGDLVRQGATFNRRKDSAGVSENVSIGGDVALMDGTLPPLFAERFRDSFRTPFRRLAYALPITTTIFSILDDAPQFSAEHVPHFLLDTGGAKNILSHLSHLSPPSHFGLLCLILEPMA